ncbi:ABC transporter permease [Alkaliphilus serpentinus]|uniref:ABC transporter permease n=1 Tax=Alkaliphilus serpentinus TaxID=1482731 RepID=A0A833HPK1_9FIRM|nr:ABC transporter permease [Alkaliphilus serpentinus]KAB3530750.1 ABC transporter permease [Alkaliphilus serpentinus]
MAFHDWKKLIIYILLPLISLTFLSYGLKGLFDNGIYLEPFEVIVVNQDTHKLSKVLVYQVEEDKNLASLVDITVLEREEEAEKLVRTDKAVAAVIIPDGFINSLEEGTNHSVRLITSLKHPVKAHMIKSIMESYMKSVSAGQSAVNAVWDYYIEMGMDRNQRREKIEAVINDITLRAYFVRSNTIQKKTLPGINSIPPVIFYSISVVLVIIMLKGVSYGKEIIEDMKQRVTDRIFLAGVSPRKYFLGKALGLFIITLVQGSIFFIPIAYFLEAKFNVSWVYSGSILLVSVFVITSLTMAGSVLIYQTDKFQYVGSIGIMTSVIIGGGFIPYMYLPDYIKEISFLTLHYWVMASVISFSGKYIVDGLQPLVIMMIFAFITMILAYTAYTKGKE